MSAVSFFSVEELQESPGNLQIICFRYRGVRPKGHEKEGIEMEQMTINFEGGLRARYPTIYHVQRAMVELSARPLKAIAADMDMSSSELSRRLNADLNENDTRVFDSGHLDALIKATGSTLVIEWLIEGHMVSADSMRQRAVRELGRLLPEISALVAACKGEEGAQS